MKKLIIVLILFQSCVRAQQFRPGEVEAVYKASDLMHELMADTAHMNRYFFLIDSVSKIAEDKNKSMKMEDNRAAHINIQLARRYLDTATMWMHITDSVSVLFEAQRNYITEKYPDDEHPVKPSTRKLRKRD